VPGLVALVASRTRIGKLLPSQPLAEGAA